MKVISLLPSSISLPLSLFHSLPAPSQHFISYVFVLLSRIAVQPCSLTAVGVLSSCTHTHTFTHILFHIKRTLNELQQKDISCAHLSHIGMISDRRGTAHHQEQLDSSFVVVLSYDLPPCLTKVALLKMRSVETSSTSFRAACGSSLWRTSLWIWSWCSKDCWEIIANCRSTCAASLTGQNHKNAHVMMIFMG